VLDGASVSSSTYTDLLAADDAMAADIGDLQDDIAALAAVDASLQSQINAIDVSALGFKKLIRVTYTGSSNVLAADDGKAHYKTDGTAVNVPTGLDVEQLTTIVNNSASAMDLTFTGSVAYLQDGAGASGTTYSILPRSTATIWHAATNVWFLSGPVEAA